jgi:integrase/recombinase XerD
MIANGSSERHQNNSLKAIVCFARFLGPTTSFLDICKKEQLLPFLDTKIKNSEQDPEKKWINTWNDYVRRIKHFLRWLYNTKIRSQDVLQQTVD